MLYVFGWCWSALRGLCAQRLEELTVASSRLENEIKSLRHAAYTDSKDSGEMSRPSSHQIVTRQQQQQHHSESPTKVFQLNSSLLKHGSRMAKRDTGK